ncbi:MAG: glucosidase [Sporocytophaga sp.]|uniref:MGH1-like glycoside hydrolase domain-containing protein n=1 Tax=Sporocytophaga sp. TaxID=2231183 RepID=UPI001B1E0F1D|nr:glucosidase [Sporocytophaga sp.]MBO9700690.1 glucosidase [Sporocytophaga sp.]
MTNFEKERVNITRSNRGWKKWGPYLSERQWGTVREDYSPFGSAWEYFSFDQSRHRAYRWGEDGISGICDYKQLVCFSVAMWNEKDPFIKDKLFGLTGNQGNHGEDVKEVYYYLDSTPTHSYMKFLYKYPQSEFPYSNLILENKVRGKLDPEYELMDTGVFDEDRYFDVYTEYAKADMEDMCIRITVHNRGPEISTIHLLPTIWFRNFWSFLEDPYRPSISADKNKSLLVEHKDWGLYNLYYEGKPDLLFCDNETNHELVYGHAPTEGYWKDGINFHVVNGKPTVNPELKGTKAALRYALTIEPGQSKEIRLRLSDQPTQNAFEDFEFIFKSRIKEADVFYDELAEGITDPDLKRIQRQAFAGTLISKQFYYFDVSLWLKGDPGSTPPPERLHGRNKDWMHLNNMEIISMPDKWEYPWYAAWDLAFHCITIAMVDPDFAKRQLILLLREWYMHPNGQIPAYEWSFNDVNPPVHAWACWRVYEIERDFFGKGDINYLERVFHKLMLNFTWWVNRKDSEGHNIFEGGFLGLDNIGVFDRSSPLPTGGKIEQADATSWMAMYSLNMLRISLELSKNNSSYEDTASKFLEHFLYITGAIVNLNGSKYSLWDEGDEFFYDVLNLHNGQFIPMKIRSMVGLIPIFAVETLEPEIIEKFPHFSRRLEWFLNYRPELAKLVSRREIEHEGVRRRFSLIRQNKLKAILKRMLDPNEFLSDYGIRALSKFHKDNPYEFPTKDHVYSVTYNPGESESGMFGGNSNWRGPIWFPVNYLIIESLMKFYNYYGDEVQVECPTGSGVMMNLKEVAEEISRRLVKIFEKDENGNRPVYGTDEKFSKDPHFKDHILFYEYFHGDNGRGIGASHQTGWTGLVAALLNTRFKEKKTAKVSPKTASTKNT